MPNKFDPNAKVIGQVLFVFPHNVEADAIQSLLEKHRITDPDPATWYPVYDILKLFGDITSGDNAMFNLVSVGMSIAEYAVLPPEFESLTADELFLRIDQIYQAQHQGDVGQLITHKIADGHYQIETISPYPDDFWYGNYYGWAKRYLPEGTPFTVQYDENTPRADHGGEATVIEIKW